MPVSSDATIGNPVSRYDIYGDVLNGHELSIDGGVDIGVNTEDASITGSSVGVSAAGTLRLTGTVLRLSGDTMYWNGMEIYNDNGTLKVR